MTTPCYICGGPLIEVKVDPRDNKVRPCHHCEDVIQDSLDEMDKERDLPYLDPDLDEFGDLIERRYSYLDDT